MVFALALIGYFAYRVTRIVGVIGQSSAVNPNEATRYVK